MSISQGAAQDSTATQYVQEVMNIGGQFQSLTVSTTAVLAIGAGSVLANRKLLVVTPTTGTIFWGTSSAVTAATGTPLVSTQNLFLSVGPAVTIFLIAAASTTVIVQEIA